MDRLPAIILIIAPGTKKGEMRFGPFCSISKAVSSIEPTPPIPDPIAQPTRCALASVISSPESLNA